MSYKGIATRSLTLAVLERITCHAYQSRTVIRIVPIKMDRRITIYNGGAGRLRAVIIIFILQIVLDLRN